MNLRNPRMGVPHLPCPAAWCVSAVCILDWRLQKRQNPKLEIVGLPLISLCLVGIQGEWRLAEELFAELEGEVAGQPLAVVGAEAAGGCNPWGAQGSATDMLASYAHAFRGDDASGAKLDGDAGGAAPEDSTLSAQLSQLGLGLSDRTAIFNPLEPYGMLPSSLTEQVRGSCTTSDLLTSRY